MFAVLLVLALKRVYDGMTCVYQIGRLNDTRQVIDRWPAPIVSSMRSFLPVVKQSEPVAHTRLGLCTLGDVLLVI